MHRNVIATTLMLMAASAANAASIYSDNFNRATLEPDWTITSGSSSIFSNALRTNLGVVYYNQLTQGAGGHYIIDFDIVNLGNNSEFDVIFSDDTVNNRWLQLEYGGSANLNFFAYNGAVQAGYFTTTLGGGGIIGGDHMEITVRPNTQTIDMRTFTDGTKTTLKQEVLNMSAGPNAPSCWVDGFIGFWAISASFGQDQTIDNFQVTVPEPASMLLLAVGSVAMLRRRRCC